MTEVGGITDLDNLLTVIYRSYGYDFRHYARASLFRRIALAQESLRCADMWELALRLQKDRTALEVFLTIMSVSVTDMFRTPLFYRQLRESVLPRLKSWPHPRIWSAGCATGEEVYSLAIVLAEEGVKEYQLYATDYNRRSLATAREGIYPLELLQRFSENYFTGGGRGSLADYYTARYDLAKMNEKLTEKVLFSHHNLVSGASFAEMQLIVCRNVLIYFDSVLQDQVLSLFSQSLCKGGFLCLGDRESIDFVSVNHHFEPVNQKLRIFRKRYAY